MFKKWAACLLAAVLLITAGLSSVTIQGAAAVCGDVSGDGDVNMKDVLLIRKFIAGLLNEIDLVAADVNGDGGIDMKDVLLMRKFIAGLIPALPGAGTVSEEPSEQPSEPSAEPSEPSAEPSEPSAEPSESSAEPSEPSVEPSESSVEPSEPSVEPSEPSVEPSESSVEPSEPSVEPSEPSAEPSEPSVEPSEPSAEPSEASGVAPVERVTLTVDLTEESPRYNTQVVTGSWTYDKGVTATFTISFTIYKGSEKTVDQLKSYVTLTGATLQGDPSVGPTVSQNNEITYTYAVVMNGNVTVTGTIANPDFNPATLNATGAVSGESSEESTVESSEESSVESSAESSEEASEQPPVTDGYRVLLSIDEESPRYTTTHRADSWVVAKNSTVTFDVIFLKVYKGSEIADWTPYLNVSAGGQSLSPTFAFGETVNQSCDVTASMSFTVTADTVITGTIHHPSYTKFIAKLNGQVGTGGISGGLSDVLVCSSEHLLFDQVYLSFYDAACSTYGVAWHTYKASGSPVLQYLEGTASTSDFAHANTVTATSSMVNSGYIYADYDPQNAGTFTTTERIDGVPDYTHKAHLPKLKAGTTYSYRVGDIAKGDYSEIYTFTTSDAAASGFTFGYLSDSQWSENDVSAGAKYKSVLDSMISVSQPAFLMHGGDMVDVVGAVHLWGNQMGSNSRNFFAKIPTFAATGNHDSATALLEHFTLDTTTAWYSYDYQNSHFIVLDNGTAAYDVHLGDAQLSWLKADLAAAKTKGYDWTIVSLHKPLYCPKQWNQNKDTYSVIAEEVGKTNRRDELTKLFADGGVDLVLQAHTHQYGRSKPMVDVNTVQTDFTTTTTGGVTYYGNLKGPIYTVMSTACEKGDPAIGTNNEYKSSNGTYYYENLYMAAAASGEDRSFGVIEVQPNRLTVSVYHDGVELYETFGLTK